MLETSLHRAVDVESQTISSDALDQLGKNLKGEKKSYSAKVLLRE